MKKNILVLLTVLSFLFSLTACSNGTLGYFYFSIDGVVQQSIKFDIFNRATLTTFYYENNEVVSSNKLKTNWQRCAAVKKDEDGNLVYDENGLLQYDETINLLYYEGEIKRVIQFHAIDNVLIDYYFNQQYQTYREFSRR